MSGGRGGERGRGGVGRRFLLGGEGVGLGGERGMWCLYLCLGRGWEEGSRGRCGLLLGLGRWTRFWGRWGRGRGRNGC